MSKPKIFISHITEEAELARELKVFIEKRFLKTLEVFASSHEESIKLGDDWMNSIKSSLNASKLIIVLCSPISIARPWINFEAGAGWLREVPVIPLCHSGLTPGKLPVPINSFQGGLISNQDDIKKLFQRIAELLNIESPDYKNDDFYKATRTFESKISNTLLIKDTTFLFGLMYRQIELIKYCVYGSTMELTDLTKVNTSERNLGEYKFNFNQIYNLFNPSLLQIHNPMTKIYQLFKETIDEMKDNIKFVLSYNHIEISPSIRELLNEFLFSVVKVGDWFHGVVLTEKNKQNKMEEMMIKMIKEEPLPPTRRTHSNLIHYFIDYYECLGYYQNWVIRYENEINGILNKN